MELINDEEIFDLAKNRIGETSINLEVFSDEEH